MKKETLFVQFFYDDCFYNELVLNNGFSNVHNDCLGKGDFFWAEQFDDKLEMENNDLPVKSGIVYISAFYYNHLVQSYIWANRFPNIQFMVGGPSIRYGGFNSDALPNNLKLINGLAEDVIFKNYIPSKLWA